MKRTLIAVALGAALSGWTGVARAQQTTERFIPVGKSPGISGVRSYLGEIVTVDVQRKTFTVRDGQTLRTIKVVARTRIWRDRSAQRVPNDVGDMPDLQAGRRVEVLYVDDQRKDTADWIKVVM